MGGFPPTPSCVARDKLHLLCVHDANPRLKPLITYYFAHPHLLSLSARPYFLSDLEKIGTDKMLLYIFGFKLSALFHITNPTTHQPRPITNPRYKHTMVTAINHQNILGLKNFLKGYISNYWQILQVAHHNMGPESWKSWEQSLTTLSLTHYKSLWDNRNKFIHGDTWIEAKQKQCERVLQHTEELYKNPPRIHSCFTPSRRVLYQDRIKHSTIHLTRWLSRVEHQRKISQLLFIYQGSTQLTIMAAFCRASLRPQIHDYPP